MYFERMGNSMKKEFELKRAKLVYTKDELGYQEVLDQLSSANRIAIVTFCISKNQTQLLDALKNVSDSVEIDIITNIPNGWKEYKAEWARKRAREQINLYQTRLKPEQIGERVNVYFQFDNHGKIIMTDQVAYIGSANYSEESANNIEFGIITYDHETIEYLFNEVIVDVIQQSKPYYVFDHCPLALEAELILSALHKQIFELRSQMYLQYDDVDEVWYGYNDMQDCLSWSTCIEANDLIKELCAIAGKIVDTVIEVCEDGGKWQEQIWEWNDQICDLSEKIEDLIETKGICEDPIGCIHQIKDWIDQTQNLSDEVGKVILLAKICSEKDGCLEQITEWDGQIDVLSDIVNDLIESKDIRDNANGIIDQFKEWKSKIGGLSVAVKKLIRLCRLCEDSEESLKPIQEWCDQIRTLGNDIEELIHSDAIYKLAHFSVSDRANEVLQDRYGMDAYDDALDYYVGKANEDAYDELSAVALNAEETVEELFLKLENYCQNYRELLDCFTAFMERNTQTKNPDVDNT